MANPSNKAKEPFDFTRLECGRRGPGHRWQIAGELPFRPWDARMQRYDENIRAAHHFRQLVGHSPVGVKQARALYPQIAAAVAIQEDSAKVDKLKIAVFADLSPAEIVRRLGVDEAALATWEALFYDARNSRDALGWVRLHIIDPEIAAGNVDLAAKLKLVAGVGPLGAAAVLDADSRAPLSAGEQLFRRKLQLDLKFERATTMTEGPEYHFRFIRLHAELKMEENRLQTLERKVVEKCNDALRKHELAHIRLEASLEREKRRTAEAARRADEVALKKESLRYACELATARRNALELAERKAAEARAAASPLSQLGWKRADEPQDNLPVWSMETPAAETLVSVDEADCMPPTLGISGNVDSVATSTPA